MADFEDSNTPTWENTIQGQINLRDAVDGTITLLEPGRQGVPRSARAWRRCWCARAAGTCSRSTSWWTASRSRPASSTSRSTSSTTPQTLLGKGSGPYFYLPKMESHLEARLWNDVFLMTQERDRRPAAAAIRATVLIETILAAFEMDEILYELREHSAGLNCGRWDYIFSVIKKFRSRPDFVLADRALVTMTTHFMRSLLAAGDQDLPRARRPRDRRHGGADPDQERPGRQRGGAREGARRQGARGRRRPRRHLGRPPGPGADRRWRRSTRS